MSREEDDLRKKEAMGLGLLFGERHPGDHATEAELALGEAMGLARPASRPKPAPGKVNAQPGGRDPSARRSRLDPQLAELVKEQIEASLAPAVAEIKRLTAQLNLTAPPAAKPEGGSDGED